MVFDSVVVYGVLINVLCVELVFGLLLCGGLLVIIVCCDGDGWWFLGYKLYSIGILVLCWLVVWVCIDELMLCVGVFFVLCDFDIDGDCICVIESWNYFGLCVLGSYEVVFDDVLLLVDYVVDVCVLDVWVVLVVMYVDVDV